MKIYLVLGVLAILVIDSSIVVPGLLAEDEVLYQWNKQADEEVMSPVAEYIPARISIIKDRYFVCLSSGQILFKVELDTGLADMTYLDFVAPMLMEADSRRQRSMPYIIYDRPNP